VNAQHALDIQWAWLVNVADGEQVERTVDTGQVRFTLLGLQQSPLVLTTNERDCLTPGHRPDRYRATGQAPAEHPIIVGNATQWLESALGLLVQLVSISHFGDAPHNQLRRQAEMLADGVIGKFVQPELTEGAHIPGDLADLIASSVGCLKSSFEQVSLFFGRLQLHFGG
ncbi:MAG: hypothetical protein NT075_25570, partial [Chloroflexi bacterium]|nr:hypothetical protein [Chloroflexota bacterium]